MSKEFVLLVLPFAGKSADSVLPTIVARFTKQDGPYQNQIYSIDRILGHPFREPAWDEAKRSGMLTIKMSFCLLILVALMSVTHAIDTLDRLRSLGYVV